MELRQAMTSTWTNRFYLPDPVPDEILHRILDSARFAPSGGNRQGWRVVIVRDPALRERLHDLYQLSWRPHRAALDRGSEAKQQTRLRSASIRGADHFADHLKDVPVLLIICVEMATLQITDAELDRQSIAGGGSIYPFVQNLLLASRAEGLGCALTTLICPQEPAVRQLLSIPEGFAVAALVALGYPEPGHVPSRLRRRAVEEFAFADEFGAPFSVVHAG
jgi:nitroreductase